MSQFLYDEKFVDIIAVIREAKNADLDMTMVADKLPDGQDQDKLWDWKEWVYDEIRKKDPDYVPFNILKGELEGLDAWTKELDEELSKALVVLNEDESSKALKEWEEKAEKALGKAKNQARKRYA